MPESPARPALLRSAQIQRAHGVGGEVRVESLGGDVERFSVGTRLIREKTGDIVTVATSRELGDGSILLSFSEHPSRESVMTLANEYLCVDRESARPLGPEEWFVSDIVGLHAVDTSGAEIGVVTEVESRVAHDLLVVETSGGTRLFPMTREFVAEVDVDAGRIVVTPWEEED